MKLGFMQGRLSPLVDGRIQAFPWDHWRDEFAIAQQLGFRYMEWTLDHARIFENPLLTRAGQTEIRELQQHCALEIRTLTADFFMQAPFYKTGADREPLLDELRSVVDACHAVGITTLVLPLVDNGSLEDDAQAQDLLAGLSTLFGTLREAGMRFVFESDFEPARLARFIERWPADLVGINYDSGNSAALGYDAAEEFSAYGTRVYNVHLKDRVRGGTTVPLGTGAADLPAVMRELHAIGYDGLYILQTARAADGDHAGALTRYRKYIEQCAPTSSASPR